MTPNDYKALFDYGANLARAEAMMLPALRDRNAIETHFVPPDSQPQSERLVRAACGRTVHAMTLRTEHPPTCTGCIQWWAEFQAVRER